MPVRRDHSYPNRPMAYSTSGLESQVSCQKTPDILWPNPPSKHVSDIFLPLGLPHFFLGIWRQRSPSGQPIAALDLLSTKALFAKPSVTSSVTACRSFVDVHTAHTTHIPNSQCGQLLNLHSLLCVACVGMWAHTLQTVCLTCLHFSLFCPSSLQFATHAPPEAPKSHSKEKISPKDPLHGIPKKHVCALLAIVRERWENIESGRTVVVSA